MENLLPFIEGSGPDGELVHLELAKDRVTIGRFEQVNDIALIPDPQQLVTRHIVPLNEIEMAGGSLTMAVSTAPLSDILIRPKWFKGVLTSPLVIRKDVRYSRFPLGKLSVASYLGQRGLCRSLPR